MAEEMAAQTGMERVSPHNHYSHFHPKRVILRCIPLRIINVTAEGSQSSTHKYMKHSSLEFSAFFIECVVGNMFVCSLCVLLIIQEFVC